MFCSFHRCKRTIVKTKESNTKFARQPIWNNNMFTYNNKTLCFKNWIRSGILHVKDLTNSKGQFKSFHELSLFLKEKSNWICEYKIVKTADI